MLSRFESKIIPEPNSGCWIWLGAVGSHGYAQVRVRKGTTIVHRILYEERFGAIPNGLELDHLCRVRCCVNPDHLEPVTRRENIRRGKAPPAIQMARQTCARGHEYDAISKTKYGFMRRCKTCRRLRYQKRNSK